MSTHGSLGWLDIQCQRHHGATICTSGRSGRSHGGVHLGLNLRTNQPCLIGHVFGSRLDNRLTKRCGRCWRCWFFGNSLAIFRLGRPIRGFCNGRLTGSFRWSRGSRAATASHSTNSSDPLHRELVAFHQGTIHHAPVGRRVCRIHPSRCRIRGYRQTVRTPHKALRWHCGQQYGWQHGSQDQQHRRRGGQSDKSTATEGECQHRDHTGHRQQDQHPTDQVLG